LLIDTGAEVNAEGGKFGTALQAATEGGHDNVVQLLMLEDSDRDAQIRGLKRSLSTSDPDGISSPGQEAKRSRHPLNSVGT